MNNTRSQYQSQDLAIIIPTKNRPHCIKSLLESLSQQTQQCGRIIVVDGADDAKEVVESFSKLLPIEYITCHPPGQIRQRNLAISMLDDRHPLVAFIDDKITFKSDSISEMIACWNRKEKNTAGISFNITNFKKNRFHFLKSIFFMSSKIPGKILISGYNVPYLPTTQDLETQWICGGASVWKQDILKTFPHKEINTPWAICEDIIYSYPISFKYPLYVASKAEVLNHPQTDHRPKGLYRFYGRNATLWRLYFVESNHNLSRLAFMWMILGQMGFRFVYGVLLFRPKVLMYFLGQLGGLSAGIYYLMRK